jgi:hypothetical protein
MLVMKSKRLTHRFEDGHVQVNTSSHCKESHVVISACSFVGRLDESQVYKSNRAVKSATPFYSL